MEQYTKFRNSSLDISSLGLETGESKSVIGCTPVDAKIIAWSTDEKDLHFCMIPCFGNTVFAVDPSAPPGDSIHPIANNLADFVGLICVCGKASLVAHAYQYSETYFELLRTSFVISEKIARVLKALNNLYHPTIPSNPYQYMVQLQKNFDYSKIPLEPSYFDICPVRPGALKWSSSFNTGFFAASAKNSDIKRINLNREFNHANDLWCIPSIYLSDKGLVIDSYKVISAEKIRNYDADWKHRPDETLGVADKFRRELEDPFLCNEKASLIINGKRAEIQTSFKLQWNPYTDNSWEARKTLEHYHLDKNNGYVIKRDCIPYKRQINGIRTIEFVLSGEPVFISGGDFYAPEIGMSIPLIHPQTGIMHELTVISQTNEALEPNFLSNHPCCYTKLQYTLTPPIHRDLFQIVDYEPSDLSMEEVDCLSNSSQSKHKQMAGYYAVSSLRFEPKKNIHWQILFKLKPYQDIQIRLVP